MRLLPLAIVIVVLTTVSAVLAQSNPFDGLDSRGRAYADPALYAKAKAQWLARVEAMPQNVDVVEGAADFFNILDRPLALELLQRASALEPNNPKWIQKLAQVHRLNAASGDVAEAQTALSLMERAYAMGTAENQTNVLTNLPAMAFEAGDIRKARAYAERCAPRRRREEKRDVTQLPHCSCAAQEMRVGPSDSDCRVRVQTTGSGAGPMTGVVSMTEKAGRTRQVCPGKTNASEPLTTCRKRMDVTETRLHRLAWDAARTVPADGPSGDRHEDGVSPGQALVRNVGTCRLDAKGDLQVVAP